MTFTFPGQDGSVVLDSPTGDGEFSIDPATGMVTGWIDHGSGFVAGQSRLFISGSFDRPPTLPPASPPVDGPSRNSRPSIPPSRKWSRCVWRPH